MQLYNVPDDLLQAKASDFSLLLRPLAEVIDAKNLIEYVPGRWYVFVRRLKPCADRCPSDTRGGILSRDDLAALKPRIVDFAKRLGASPLSIY